MWRLGARNGDMVAAIADTTADIEERYAPNSLNAILLAPDKLYAISWHDPAKVPAPQLRARGYADRPDDIACYFDLAYRATADSVVVGSSGWPMPGWTPLPRRHVLVTDRATLHTSVLRWRPPRGVWGVLGVAEAPEPAGSDRGSDKGSVMTEPGFLDPGGLVCPARDGLSPRRRADHRPRWPGADGQAQLPAGLEPAGRRVRARRGAARRLRP